ncbi:hypothetical protein [[Phormidium] sp. ETS-05]|uniref:hypothetical protein n=1 Tax=[Phormidium] sp. ETS-05 TaxID=222819 RepID=UPI0018EF0A08|nr:hypothetical protein [[Phormidium] sp. ETS-05]
MPLPVMVGVNVPPAVLPVKLMSLASKPVTVSEKVMVKLMGDVGAGSVWAAACSMVTVGTIPSMMRFLLAPNELGSPGWGG